MSIYSSITNKMQSYTKVFITINALHVSGSSSAHHQEHETVYTASSICRVFLLLTAIVSELTRCCVHSFELLVMGGGTA